jgi:hypothetical protein
MIVTRLSIIKIKGIDKILKTQTTDYTNCPSE